MENEEEWEEYVLAQDGIIYRGVPPRFKELAWTFGQFEPGILDICLRILDENPKFVHDAKQDCAARADPVYVTRVLSAMINCSDDRGVLMGCWSDDYSFGVKPSHWTGSEDILRQWNYTNCLPVRYGQCWVFAAVNCTVSRALGIPCRVITNYDSAHDCNCNLLMEYIYNEDNKEIGDDSIWNYHCWVESWMTRPDLKEGFGGWQASDPTPQEQSEGVFCCGPVPLSAIKNGELTMKYDAPFVYAEVNADVVVYVTEKTGEKRKVLENTKEVGHHISTKAVGKDERLDITNLYKYPEATATPLTVEYSKYGPTITDDRMIKVKAILMDSETRKFYKEVKTIVLDTPPITVKIAGVPKVNQKLTADIALQNPLPVPLQDCIFTVNGVRLTAGQSIVQKIGTVNPKEYAATKVEFAPTAPGKKKLVVAFDSDKLSNISAFETIVITG